MPRVFVPPEILIAEEPCLTGDKAKRLTRVLRLGEGDAFTAMNGAGREYACRILSASTRSVHFVIEAEREVTSEPRLRLILAQAVPKGQRFEWVIQKAVELGAHRVVPLITNRGVVRSDDPDDGDEDLESGRERRWRLVATNAAEQCGRAFIPEVARPMSLGQALSALAEAQCDAIFILDENERAMSLRRAMEGASDARRMAIVVGPEGGFTANEIEHATTLGAQPVSVGPRILRTETAGLAACAIVMALAGELEFR